MTIRFNHRAFAVLAILLIIACAVVDAWDGRYVMNPDGISYIEIAEAYVHHDFKAAVSGYWSPLYSWLLGLAFLLVHPSPALESTVVHLVNLCIFLASLFAFQYLVSSIRPMTAVYRIFFYAVFAWSSLSLTGLADVTPDLCVSALIFLAVGFVVRLEQNPRSINPLMFGLVLALCYQAKTPMIFVCVVLLLAAWRAGYGARNLTISSLTVALIAFSWVGFLSLQRGHPTIGDTAKLNYAWFVNHIDMYSGWIGAQQNSGTPTNPPKVLSNSPLILSYEGAPFHATVPSWYDPSYWHEGLRVHLSLKEQIGALAEGLTQLRHILFLHVEIIAGLLALLYMNSSWRFRYPSLLLAAITPPIIYTLVGHVDPRFLGPFVVLLWAFFYLGFIDDKPHDKVTAVLAVITVSLSLSVLTPRLGKAYAAVRHENTLTDWDIANEMNKMGFQRGDKCAYIGDAKANYFGRLAGISFVVEVPADVPEPFWSLNDKAREQAFAKMAEEQIRAVITDNIPRSEAKLWSPVPHSRYYVRFLGSNSPTLRTDLGPTWQIETRR